MKKFMYFVGAYSIVLILLVATLAFIDRGDEDNNDNVIVVALREDMVANMITNNTIDVGDIRVWNDDEKLYVEYLPDIENGWLISETNLHVGENSGDFPVAGGQKNLVPGNFKYKRNYDPPIISDVYEIDMGDWEKGNVLYIAAHAVVAHSYIDIDQFGSMLPETASIKVVFGWGSGLVTSPSTYYFDPVSILDTDIEGEHEGWCIDLGHNIEMNEEYNTLVFSTYEDLPQWLSEILGNDDHNNQKSMKKINWLLNQNLMGEPYTGNGAEDAEVFTMEDIQMAIWTIIDPDGIVSVNIPDDLLDLFDEERVSFIVSMTDEHDDYIPGSGDSIGIIFAPVEDGEVIAQVSLVMVDVPTYTVDEENCWGSIWDKENKGWATRWNDEGDWASYFSYKIK